MEVVDYDISLEEVENKKDNFIKHKTYMINMDRSDEELFKSFKPNCRRFIRQFERKGAFITEVKPSIEFAYEYYDQLIEVFAKRNLRPTYDRQKVIDLMEAFKDNPENILCLKACRPDGKCIATAIFLGLQSRSYFWGGASYKEDQHYRPNEYLMWHGIKYWGEKGVKYLDMVGLRDYKEKFAPDLFEYPRIIFTKYRILITCRNKAKKLMNILGGLKGA